MKHIKITTTVIFLLLGLGVLYAQETVPVTGGDATGSGGSSSYTVGQLAYITSTGTNESVSQGVQQPYETYVVTGIQETSINLELSVYPNPTANYLTLKTKSNENLSFHLYDMQGKLLESKKLTSNTNIIKMEPNRGFVKLEDKLEINITLL